MFDRWRRLGGMLCIAMLVLTIAGCEKSGPVGEKELVGYVRNARLIHPRNLESVGKVRRLPSPWQKYVDKVLKADAELQELVYPLRKLAFLNSLPKPDDAFWNDEEKVEARYKELRDIVVESMDKRRDKMDALRKAIAKAPKDETLDTADQEAIWDALSLNGGVLDSKRGVHGLEFLGMARFGLLEGTKNCLASAPKDSDEDQDQGEDEDEDKGEAEAEEASTNGLEILPEPCRSDVISGYVSIVEMMTAYLDDLLRHYEEELDAGRERLAEIKGQNIVQQERLDYDFRNSQRKFIREELKSLREELEELPETGDDPAAKALAKAREKLLPRVKELEPKAKEDESGDKKDEEPTADEGAADDAADGDASDRATEEQP